jgi:hypothetical protein
MRYKTIQVPALLFILALVFGIMTQTTYMFANGEGNSENDRPQVEWVEPEDLTEVERLKWRPGNFGALAAVADHLEGMFALRPELRAIAFPYWSEGRKVDSMEVFESGLRRSEQRFHEREESPRNKARSYAMHLTELRLCDIPSRERAWVPPADLKVPERLDRAIKEARSEHGENMVLVRAAIVLKSLQSPKIEAGEQDDFVWFLVTRKQEGWRVCVWDKD